MGLAQMWDRKAIKYSSVNGTNGKSFGCQDYMPKIFQSFVETQLRAEMGEESKE